MIGRRRQGQLFRKGVEKMSDFQSIKRLISDYYRELDQAPPGGAGQVIARYASGDYSWRGMHPFNELEGAETVGEAFWEPFRHAVGPIQRRPDVFMAGSNTIEPVGGEWVCCMGHLMGLFDHHWLGIPPTGKMLFLRFAEFHQVEGGKIRQTALFFDIPSVMRQAGRNPFPTETGAWFLTPGPKTHDGLLHKAQDPQESRKTLDLINRMIGDLVAKSRAVSKQTLTESWQDDMIWFGPTGIGATYTIPRYRKQHQLPFRNNLDDIVFNGHVCRFAEGRFGGFFGWPNLTMRPAGGFMGFPGSGKKADMRVVDIYRREGELLAENWVFIDLLWFYQQQGVDILARMQEIEPA